MKFQSPRPLRGATRKASSDIGLKLAFQSPRPLRGATGPGCHHSSQKRDFNPRAPYGARLLWYESEWDYTTISIPAPLTGRDSKNA